MFSSEKYLIMELALLQRRIVWNDPDIDIKWSKKKPFLSKKDSTALKLSQHKNLPKWKKTSKFFHWKGRNYS